VPAVIIAFVILLVAIGLLVVTIIRAVAAKRRQEEYLDSVEQDLTGRYRTTRKIHRMVHGRNPPGWNTEQFTASRGKRR
jgi:hypothetical protein